MSKKILITGSNSNVAKHLFKLIPKNFEVQKINSKDLDFSNLNLIKKKLRFFLKFDQIYFFHSTIGTNRVDFKNISNIYKSVSVNLLSQIIISEYCLKHNKNLKIFFSGSESGLKGSYDIIYGLMKTSIHRYVEERRISFPKQKIFCLAPSTISDSKFTKSRKDQENVHKSISNNPRRRGIKSKEIAEIIFQMMFDNKFEYLTNTVIHLNGGKFTRM
ncbi:MAG: hypothetical protein CBD97_02500 [Pelagibacteraceae bacterium TMED237]|nr:MAG: hypothetical protein CBD97_02500 [Pelagibacteraceae bacterium TMED237]|tara:strand:- start:1638 stop:2288 length:651 start_codon:yes stop_codon:yes gene_type:complete